MVIEDRVTRAFLAGTAGAVAQDIYVYIAKLAGLTDRTYLDYARIMIMFKNHDGVLATIVSIIGHMITDMLFAVLFVYFIKVTSAKYMYLKGIIYGGVIWFILIGLGTLFRLPVFTTAPPSAALALFVGAVMYGAIVVFTLKLLRSETEEV